MKVRIRKPVPWIGPYQISDCLKYIGVSNDRCFAIGEKLNKTWLRPFCEWLYKKRQRKDKIVIEYHDTWSMDHTLAPIILPMLEQLKKSKQGAPWVDPEDVPEELRPDEKDVEKYKHDGEVDSKYFERWDYVINEMIFAFRALTTDWESQFYSGSLDILSHPVDEDLNPVDFDDAKYFLQEESKDSTFEFDTEGYMLYSKRIDQGLVLFGKYFRSLWD